MGMLLAFVLLALGTSGPVYAQSETSTTLTKDNAGNAAVDFALTSAASQSSACSGGTASSAGLSYQASSPPSFSSFPDDAFPLVLPASSSTPLTCPSSSLPEPASPVPAAPAPKYDYTKRDYRGHLGVGVALVRFRSSVYYATAVGVNSSLAYFVKDWLAIEGAVTSAFSGQIFANERVKYVGYGAGPKISLERSRLEPWAHLLVGGVHVVPQTGFGSQNGFELVAGGGVDYSLVPEIAVRLEGDWVNTHAFGQSQNNGQATLGVVFHF